MTSSSILFRAALSDDIIRQGELAYNPENGSVVKQEDFAKLLSTSKTLSLLPVLTTLVQPGRVKPWLQPHLLRELSLIPLRSQGVRSTIEFVLSVHPNNTKSSGSPESSTPQSRGANISLEALNSASRLISAPPQAVSPDRWFSDIAPQLFLLLDGEGGLEMVKVAAYIIGYGILGRRELGAPGKPGWKAFAEPILSRIDPALGTNFSTVQGKTDSLADQTPSVKPHNLVVSGLELAGALRRLVSLLTSHPNPGLSKRLLERLLLPLWSISSWPRNNSNEFEAQYRAPARFLLQTLLQLSPDASHLITIAKNLLFIGNKDPGRFCWTYKSLERGIQIQKSLPLDNVPVSIGERGLLVLDQKVNDFIEILRPLKENDFVPELFLSFCKNWLLPSDDLVDRNILTILKRSHDEDNIEESLINARIMQGVMDALPNRLIGDSMQVLKLSEEVLRRAVQNIEDLDSDDTVAVTLSLLNIIFTSSSFSSISKNQPTYKSLRSSLISISEEIGLGVSSTAQNLLLLLDFQERDLPLPELVLSKLDKDIEDRKSYNLGLSYLKDADSSPPIRAQGLDLISGLITSNSSVLDIPATLIILLTLLKDDDEYIYLKVIKCFTLFSINHSKTVVHNLIEHYVDAQEEASVDSRLHVGEALLQVIQKAGETFAGDLARETTEALISIAGRRGYRPKGEAEKQKNSALVKKNNEEAEEAWAGPVPQLEESTIEDEILTKIVEGWEGKRAEEDVRMRTSALSIFGSALETNAAGIGSVLISNAVDLSINVLMLEPEPEKAILRRSAILLVMSLVQALDKAREDEKKLGFGLAGQSLDDVVRVLQYVSVTDNDGLVRQHAKDVMAELQTWQVKSLVHKAAHSATKLQEITGLSVNLRGDSVGTRRPRIEEIG